MEITTESNVNDQVQHEKGGFKVAGTITHQASAPSPPPSRSHAPDYYAVVGIIPISKMATCRENPQAYHTEA